MKVDLGLSTSLFLSVFLEILKWMVISSARLVVQWIRAPVLPDGTQACKLSKVLVRLSGIERRR